MFIIIFLVIIIALLVLLSIKLKKPGEQTFNGFIIWGRESVYFVEDINIEDNKINTVGEATWIKESNFTDELYDKAKQVSQISQNNTPDDIRIIQTKFNGLLYQNSKEVPVSPMNFSSALEITKILEYTNRIN